MPLWIVNLVVFVGILGALVAGWHCVTRLRVPGNEIAPMAMMVSMVGLMMCDRYVEATGDPWSALPTALVFAASVPAYWIHARRRARALADDEGAAPTVERRR